MHKPRPNPCVTNKGVSVDECTKTLQRYLRNLDNIKNDYHRLALVLEMGCQSHVSIVVGGTPGVCSKADIALALL